MPYGQGHRLLTISGSLWGVERWTIGMRFANANNATQPTQAEVDATEAPIRTWFTAVNSQFPNVHSVDEIKLAPQDLDGHYPPGLDSVVKVPSPAIFGQSVAGSTWPQIAYVVSLTTALPRGKGHIGRVYLPPLHAGIIPNAGRRAAADVDLQLATFRTLILALNGLSGVGTLTVFGKTGAGTTQTVTGFRGGLVMDTQRRRRRSLQESYRTLAL